MDSSIRRLCYLLLLAFVTSVAHADKPIIELEGKNETPAALFVQEVLEKAYANIGYQVQYRNVPLARSFVEANNGRLDGLRARIDSVANKYPNLIKVPFNLLDFQLVLLADRRVCGICDLSQITHVVVPRGFKAFEDFLESNPYELNITQVTGVHQSLDILAAGKVQAAIMSDTNVPDRYYDLNHHWIKQTLATLPDYHYLNKKHARLVPLLLEQFEAFEESGELASIRKKYGVSEVYREPNKVELGEVTAIGGDWLGFTDTDEGTYWKMLRKIYATEKGQIKHTTSNWKRAKQLFKDGKIDLLVGAYEFEVKANMIRSQLHIDYEWPVSAYGKDIERLKLHLAGTSSASACYPLGYEFDQWLPESIEAYEVGNFADCERMLLAGRVDVLVNYSLDVIPEINANYQQVEIAEGRPLFLVFRDTERGKKLRHVFEREFRKLVENNQIEALYPDKEQFERAKIIVKPSAKWQLLK